LFENATIDLGKGKKLEIVVERKDPAHPYIQSFSLNGKAQQRTWFHHSEIAQGGKLVLTMGPAPNPELGSEPNSLPPSLHLG
jgi:putative alpha-1,2-mannosidase